MNIILKEAVVNIENKYEVKFEYRNVQFYDYLTLPERYGSAYEEYSTSILGNGEWREISICSSKNEGMAIFIYGLNEDEIPQQYIEESFGDVLEIFEAKGILRSFKLKQLLESLG